MCMMYVYLCKRSNATYLRQKHDCYCHGQLATHDGFHLLKKPLKWFGALKNYNNIYPKSEFYARCEK